MKEIQLTQNKIALIDDEDYDLISEYKWYADKAKYYYYACSTINNILMHRFILKVIDSNIRVDHKNHNTLDNRRINLRIATGSDNGANRNLHINNSSGYKVYLGINVAKNGELK